MGSTFPVRQRDKEGKWQDSPGRAGWVGMLRRSLSWRPLTLSLSPAGRGDDCGEGVPHNNPRPFWGFEGIRNRSGGAISPKKALRAALERLGGRQAGEGRHEHPAFPVIPGHALAGTTPDGGLVAVVWPA